jgi:arylsulfatase A-like enzyme
MIACRLFATALLALPLAFGGAAMAQSAAKKPNIVVIMADDVGIWNVSAYHRGMMGGSTPNIDRIAKEGALFTDYYAQQSCTAGRAAFILGQTPFRTGLLKVGMPAAKQGLQDKDPTIAELLKPYGYATAQIGKNHLGDRNEFLPTVHGFDEFYGILYHLNAMEEPYEPDYPKAPQFLASFGNEIAPRSKFNDSIVEALFIARLSLFASQTNDVSLLIARTGPRRVRGTVEKNCARYQRRNKTPDNRRQNQLTQNSPRFRRAPENLEVMLSSALCRVSNRTVGKPFLSDDIVAR